ncbi:hypothetical protein [Chelativorans alearense]|uniref:hypothetical protein n=1 Tax=Chelativorans alearense TaxID=2681495 RepID=UPI0013D1830F|nr:hypothetical protein [Chelativorans alearense]
MARRFSDELLLELHSAVKRALRREGTVNVPAVASEIRDRHAVEDISLAEIEAQVMATALAMGAAIFFQAPVGTTRKRRAKPGRARPLKSAPPKNQA